MTNRHLHTSRIYWPISTGVLVVAIAAALLLGGCGSTASTRTADTGRSASASSDWVARWEAEASSWQGVPHRWGGTTRRGIDCSALVQTLHRSVSGVRLPRTTRAQVRSGERVRKRDLQPGDLVFFRLEKSRHVGVYLDRGRFVHASASQGVMISNLAESYWTRSYWTARRISAPHQGQHLPASRDPAPAPSAPRGGW